MITIFFLLVSSLKHSIFSSLFCGGFAVLTFEDLGIVPHKLEGYPIEFLISYRKGGPQFGSTVSERMNPDDMP